MAGKNTGNLTSKIVSNLSEGSILLDTDDIRESYLSLLDKVKKFGKLGTTALKLLNKACGYLFDPEEGFIALKKQTVSLFAFFGEMLQLSDDIPRDMLPKLEEIKKYLAESETLIDTMKKEICELLKFVDERAFKSDFNLSRTDLKKIQFRQRKILSDRSICKEYLAQTKKTFDEIEQNVSGKLLLAGVITSATLIGGGVLLNRAVETVATAAGTGLLVISAKLFLICCRYSTWFSEYQATVQSKLDILNMEMKAIEERIKLLEEKVSDATE